MIGFRLLDTAFYLKESPDTGWPTDQQGSKNPDVNLKFIIFSYRYL